MIVTSIEGRSEYKAKKSAKVNRSLSVSFVAPIRESVSVPPEIGGLLDALRAGPVLKRDLPTIEIASLRWNQAGQEKTPMANFTVLCSPAAETKARGPGLQGGSESGPEVSRADEAKEVPMNATSPASPTTPSTTPEKFSGQPATACWRTRSSSAWPS